jgi:hypothetical protein
VADSRGSQLAPVPVSLPGSPRPPATGRP